jgi:hypothetical protein
VEKTPTLRCGYFLQQQLWSLSLAQLLLTVTHLYHTLCPLSWATTPKSTVSVKTASSGKAT